MVEPIDISNDDQHQLSRLVPESRSPLPVAFDPIAVTDNFPNAVPIGHAEIEAIEAYMQDVLDAVLTEFPAKHATVPVGQSLP